MRAILIFLSLCATLSADSERIVADTILGEAANQGQDGMRAVAQVILNRSRDRGIPCDSVCMQRKQFSCWLNPKIERWRSYEEANRIAEALAAFICNDIDVAKDLIGDRTHYYAHDLIFPYWANDCSDAVIVKDHTFVSCK